jgi:copper(I)-binding protein
MGEPFERNDRGGMTAMTGLLTRRNVILAAGASALTGTTFAVMSTRASAQGTTLLEISDAWASGRRKGGGPAEGYMVLRNRSELLQTVVSARTPIAARVQLHTTFLRGQRVSQPPVRNIELPGGTTVALRPGGLHLRFIDLRTQLRDGQRFPITVRLSNGAEFTTQMVVRRA